MRLISFGSPGAERPGIVDADDQVIPLDPLLRRRNLGCVDTGAILALWPKLADAIEDERTSARQRIPLRNVRLGPPVPRPHGIFGIGMNYGEGPNPPSVTPMSYLDAPPIFMKPAGTLVGHRDPVLLPNTSTAVDYEVELAIVIGRGGRDIAREDADRHIAGYLLANDITAHDLTRRGQILVGKGYDSFLPCGPWLLTADSVVPDSIELRLSVNNEPRQAGKVADMRLDVPTIVELISNFTALHPGDLILTGTPPGSGIGMHPPQFLADGDDIAASAGPLGELRNRCQKEK
ncbi:MAG TPA: fumarylacetoacetate hydrolase family protein [Pseudonocardiaceae bacterium]|jgi:2-keto-4-pentenoate hydratase/2-oxohepta-3-ene-1,7-dioic acid hydratase in catechol pathway|nr:fumarylacetoacetate hydrolase family protein [Pseudonocardiaceae bacterium]